MSLLLESIKLNNGVFLNLSYHEHRMNRSLKKLCGVGYDFDLENFLRHIYVPEEGLYKCRLLYDENQREVEFHSYQFKPIRSIQVVHDNGIEYDLKYVDRQRIERNFAKRGVCDDVLIIKNGLITDTSFCNIVFKKGKYWYTPWSALLKGTQRQKLIEENVIQEEDIRLDDIGEYESFRLINAMMEFNGLDLDIAQIVI